VNLTINIPIKLMIRATRLIERLVVAYEKVHAAELQVAPPVDSNVGKFYYQDDRKLYEAEHSDEGVEVV
jgi:hypothetical protein